MPPHTESDREHTLRPLASPSDWEDYHRIGRTELFEAREPCADGDPGDSDDRRPGHHPMLLFHGADPVGIIRIDLHGSLAIFRRAAVRTSSPDGGHGPAMLSLAEAFARARGCTRVISSVDARAIAWFEQCGFARTAAAGNAAAPVVMEKHLVSAT